MDLTPAPDIPFVPSDWVPDGFPACPALTEWGATLPARLLALRSGAAGGGAPSGTGASSRGGGTLLEALWCPLPLTAPAMRPEQRLALEWDEEGRELLMRRWGVRRGSGLGPGSTLGDSHSTCVGG